MKKIYLILSHTGTFLSNIIRMYTKDEFSHISIALDEELEEMYSFGRLRPYNAFVGGFIQERVNEGTFKRFKNTQCAIYAMEVEDENFEKIKNKIYNTKAHKEKYKFNILGLLAVSIHKKVKLPRTFYCAEYVKYVLQKSDINLDLPEIIKPEDFKNIPNIKEEYRGLLREYKNNKPINYIKDMMDIYSRKEGLV